MSDDVQVLETLPAMQRHADAVRASFTLWTAGVVPVSRARRLVRRFQAIYQVNLHRNVRARRRKRGEGSAMLVLYRLPTCVEAKLSEQGRVPELVLGWTLLVTDGESVARHREQLRDATDSETPITIGPYELIRLPRKGQAKPAWTFRMSRAYYQQYRERVIRSARGDVHELPHVLLKSLYSEPGWAAIRSSVGHIVALWRREFRRRKRTGVSFPVLPKLRYVQRMNITATPLSELVRSG